MDTIIWIIDLLRDNSVLRWLEKLKLKKEGVIELFKFYKKYFKIWVLMYWKKIRNCDFDSWS